MKYINPTYKLNNDISEKILIEQYDFHRYNNEIVYRFPVYKYNNKPLIFGEFIYNEEENQLHIRAIDHNGYNYNYNEEYFGISKLIENINSKINTKINEFQKKGVIK